MDFSHYSNEPVAMAVDLVNTFDAFSGVEHLVTTADLETFVAGYEQEWGPFDWRIREADLHEVRALRSRLRDVFTADTAEAAVDTVNQILSYSEAVPRVSLHSDDPHLHFEPSGADIATWLGTVTAMGLAVTIVDGGMERLGVCDAGRCDDVYVDVSRNRSRRHCSDTCTTRENVAAHRRRQKLET
ncbi:MAG TPA: CGNR zinc finger domain-containing protein [Acidimicrobiia bacterium]